MENHRAVKTSPVVVPWVLPATNTHFFVRKHQNIADFSSKDLGMFHILTLFLDPETSCAGARSRDVREGRTYPLVN